MQAEGTASARTLTWAKDGCFLGREGRPGGLGSVVSEVLDVCRLRSREVLSAQPRKGLEFCSKHDGNLWRVLGK